MNEQLLTQHFRGQYGEPMMTVQNGDPWVHVLTHLVGLALLVLGTIVVVRLLVSHYKPIPQDPLDVAKMRYAKGEITKEELASIRKELKV
ncbi:MAG TPA: SHOCT domain-containing protein, partial [Patescibacteria group bacterium]|nr:SHOCT domain-containing protein [Patescibacteria group bacterium]